MAEETRRTAPVGELRWRPPQPAASWQGVRPADRFADQCMQARVFGDMMFRNAGISEDCLYLNVYAAPNASDLPVVVWIRMHPPLLSLKKEKQH